MKFKVDYNGSYKGNRPADLGVSGAGDKTRITGRRKDNKSPRVTFHLSRTRGGGATDGE